MTEPVWLTSDPPAPAREFWKEYPAVDSIEKKLSAIERAGFENVGHFVLPPSSWTKEYYRPLAERVTRIETVWTADPMGEDVLREARRELHLYELSSGSFGYGFFVMRLH